MQRREFLKNTTGTLAGASALLSGGLVATAENGNSDSKKKVKVAVVGLGGRGRYHTTLLAAYPEVEIVALCEPIRERVENAAKICTEAGKNAPKIFCGDETTWEKMFNEVPCDAVIIATNWESHAEIALGALKRKCYVGAEVPIALSVDECWKLVDASEKYETPCMMLENWSFRRDNLAVLNMIRLGLFGEIMHAHCAYSHDCTEATFFDRNTGKARRQAEILQSHNRNFYPTHALGPVLSWLDINVGDRFTEIYSVATAARGVNAYLKSRFGEEHPQAKTGFKQGDIVTSVLKTAKGKTVVLNLDMFLPRPYANRWLVQGTGGIYDEEKGSIYLRDVSPRKDQWEPWQPYEEKYNHRYWETVHEGGHGGVDPLQMRLFIDAVLAKTQTPLDVYDSVVMSAVVGLSEESIAKNLPVEFPDFTRGKWQTRRPRFAL